MEFIPSPHSSQIIQLDGNLSVPSSGSSDNMPDVSSTTSSYCDTDDEMDSNPTPAVLTPVPDQLTRPGQPIQLEVKPGKHNYSSSLPLCMMLNARSLYNKIDSF